LQQLQVLHALENGSLWQPTPQMASWRIDVVTAAKAEAAEGLAEPIALIELQARQVCFSCIRCRLHSQLHFHCSDTLALETPGR